MPKTRRGGQKYHLRKVIAQLYAPPSNNNYLGVDYSSDFNIESVQVNHRINLARYTLIPVNVTPATIHPSTIPENDPRYKVYAATAILDQDRGKVRCKPFMKSATTRYIVRYFRKPSITAGLSKSRTIQYNKDFLHPRCEGLPASTRELSNSSCEGIRPKIDFRRVTNYLLMYPPVLNRRQIYCPIEVPYSAWLTTALCATAIFYSCVNNGRKICHVCYDDILDSQERRSYELTVHHYFHIGHEERFEICSACHAAIPLTRSHLECHTCRVLRDDFAEYLRESRDDPYNSLQFY